jgi:hypothetical protein
MPSLNAHFSPKFEKTLKAVLADNVVEKIEARKLRQVALADLKAAPQQAAAADAFSSQFEKLGAKSADKVTGRYISRVAGEFTERANVSRASKELQTYLKGHASSLPKALKDVDLKGEFEVGASMNGGIWLRVPLKDSADMYKSQDAVAKLLKSMGKGDIWII